jgi:hypothetical protein
MTWDGWCSKCGVCRQLLLQVAASARVSVLEGIASLESGVCPDPLPSFLAARPCMCCMGEVFSSPMHAWRGPALMLQSQHPATLAYPSLRLFRSFLRVLNCLYSSSACVELCCAFWVVLAIFTAGF